MTQDLNLDDRLELLTAAGIVRATRVRPNEAKDPEQRAILQAMLEDVALALNTAAEDLYLLTNLVFIGPTGHRVGMQPYLVLQKQAVLGVFATPPGHD